MNDFMRWLYANYIKPQLDAASMDGYEQSLSVMNTTLDANLHIEYEKTLEYYCGNAFLLGLRTGEGLCRAAEGNGRDYSVR